MSTYFFNSNNLPHKSDDLRSQTAQAAGTTDNLTSDSIEPRATTSPSVIVYSTSSCPFCIYAKDFFDNHKVSYVEKNVGKDQEAAREMVSKSGQMGVPVIDINGTIIVGYQPEKFAQLLGIKE